MAEYEDPNLAEYVRLSHELCDEHQKISDWLSIVCSWGTANILEINDVRRVWDRHGCVRCLYESLSNLEDHAIELTSHPKTGHFILVNVKEITWFKETLRKWRDPSTRRPDRYYCRRHTQRLGCGAALYNDAGMEAGHVAWAYEMPREIAQCFQAEGKQLIPRWYVGEMVLEGGSQGLADDPIQYYKDLHYSSWKGLSTEDGNWEEALLQSLTITRMPYTLLLNNCQHAAHEVLKSFGAVGIPGQYYTGEATYFHWIQAPARQLRPVSEPPHIPPTPPQPAPPPGKELKALADGLRAKMTAHTERVESILEDARKAQPKGGRSAKRPAGWPAILKAMGQVQEREGVFELDGQPMQDFGPLEQRADRELVKQLAGKLKEAVKESDWRKDVNKNPLAEGILPTRPKVSIDTKVGWVDLDYF